GFAALHCRALHLEVRDEQELAGADEGSGGEVLLEVVLVHSVPLVEEGDIGTEHLDGDQVVHRHSRLREDGLEAVEYVSGSWVTTAGTLPLFGSRPMRPAM